MKKPLKVQVLLLFAFFQCSFSEAQNGKKESFIKWRLQTNGTVFQPIYDQGVLYFPLNKSFISENLIPTSDVILAVNVSNGSPKWAFKPERPMINILGKSNNLLYIGAGGEFLAPNLIFVLDAHTGKGLWHIVNYTDIKSNEIQEGVFLVKSGGIGELGAYVMSQALGFRRTNITQDETRAKIISMDYQKGKELWRIYLDKIGGSYDTLQTMSIESGWTNFATRGNLLFFSTREYIATADIITGKLYWVNQTLKNRWRETDIEPKIQGRFCYLGGENIVALEISTGKTIWKHEIEAKEEGKLLTLSNNILLAEIMKVDSTKPNNQKFALLALDLGTGKNLWRVELDGRVKEIINKNKCLVKTDSSITICNLFTGDVKNYPNNDKNTWIYPDGSFILSGGENGIVSILQPDGNLVDTIHLGSPIRDVFKCDKLPYLFVTLKLGDLLALDNKKIIEENVHVETAVELLKNVKQSPLPPLKTIKGTALDIQSDNNHLRNKRYGFSFERAVSQICINGCGQESFTKSYGLSYKRYYGKWFAFQPELFYLQRGSQGNKVSNNIATGDTYKYDLRYLDFHLLGELGTPANKRLRIYFFSGPFYGYPFKSLYSIYRKDGRIEEYPFKPNHDLGLIGGYGFDLAFKKFFIFVEGRGQFGFRPIVTNTLPTRGATLARGKNTAVSINIGFGF